MQLAHHRHWTKRNLNQHRQANRQGHVLFRLPAQAPAPAPGPSLDIKPIVTVVIGIDQKAFRVKAAKMNDGKRKSFTMTVATTTARPRQLNHPERILLRIIVVIVTEMKKGVPRIGLIDIIIIAVANTVPVQDAMEMVVYWKMMLLMMVEGENDQEKILPGNMIWGVGK